MSDFYASTAGFVRLFELPGDIAVASVHMDRVRQEYFGGRDLVSPAADLDLFDRFLFDTGVELPGDFSTYRVFKRQIETLCGRSAFCALARSYLAGYHRVLKRDSGEPYIDNLPNSISISHAGGYACAALSLGERIVGIDIEKIRPFTSREAFFRVAFPEEDMTSLMSLDDEAVMERWTLKEAFLKIIGRGFAEQLKAVKISDDEIYYRDKQIESLREIIVFDGHCIAVLSVGKEREKELRFN